MVFPDQPMFTSSLFLLLWLDMEGVLLQLFKNFSTVAYTLRYYSKRLDDKVSQLESHYYDSACSAVHILLYLESRVDDIDICMI